ncbi:MAG TPA: homoserine dehydrogenase [Candidatus Tetragenococcus pullicola]|nr:homoserine dehydrogenase [Candidatus Tetragenococcus pullicola]
MKNELSIALLGLGVVGSGVMEIITTQNEKIYEKTGYRLHIDKALVRSKEASRKVVEDKKIQLTTSIADIIEDPKIDVVVELIGGIHPAKEFISQSLENKKHVVTANKDLLAIHGTELRKLARQKNVSLFYEASVAGGIPILRTLSTHFATDNITAIYGILNGTTNFILTKMIQENLSYEMALKKAQELGYAEADPKNDVGGLDTAYKLIILTKLAFGMDLSLEDIEIQGIQDISKDAVNRAQKAGYEIKLIGQAESINDKLNVKVAPVWISQKHPLAMIANEKNGVFIQSDSIGESMFYGPGAGSLPTATSVLADLINIVENSYSEYKTNQYINFYKEKQFAPAEKVNSHYYLLFAIKEKEAFCEMIKQWKKENLFFSQPVFEGNEAFFITKKINTIQLNNLLQSVASIAILKHKMSVMEDKNAN